MDTLTRNPGTRLQAVLSIETTLEEVADHSDAGGIVGQFAQATSMQLDEVRGEVLGEATRAAAIEFRSIGGSPSSAAEWKKLWNRTGEILLMKGWPVDAVAFVLDVAPDMVNDEVYSDLWPVQSAAPTGAALSGEIEPLRECGCPTWPDTPEARADEAELQRRGIIVAPVDPSNKEEA